MGAKKRPASARDAAPALAAAAEGDAGAGAPPPPEDLFLVESPPFKRAGLGRKRDARPKRLRQILAAEKYEERPPSEPTFVNIDAPPSTYPPKRYCDITGLPAPYTDPRTKLRYHDAAAYAQIRQLTQEQVQQLLAVRNANVVLR